VSQDQGQGDQDAQADDEGDGCSRQQAAAGAGIAHPAAKLSENRPAVTDDDQRGGGGVRAGRFARASPFASAKNASPHQAQSGRDVMVAIFQATIKIQTSSPPHFGGRVSGSLRSRSLRLPVISHLVPFP